MYQERIYLAEIQTLLRYRDKRSIRRWCHNNNVRMIKDHGSNRPFVLKEEFDQAIETNNRGDNSGKSSKREMMMQKFNQISESVRDYKPGENEKKILSIFTSLL